MTIVLPSAQLFGQNSPPLVKSSVTTSVEEQVGNILKTNMLKRQSRIAGDWVLHSKAPGSIPGLGSLPE